jgi:hypothetical protein
MILSDIVTYKLSLPNENFKNTLVVVSKASIMALFKKYRSEKYDAGYDI